MSGALENRWALECRLRVGVRLDQDGAASQVRPGGPATQTAGPGAQSASLTQGRAECQWVGSVARPGGPGPPVVGLPRPRLEIGDQDSDPSPETQNLNCNCQPSGPEETRTLRPRTLSAPPARRFHQPAE